MPTLTLELPDAAYRDALAFTPTERVRLVAAALSAARSVSVTDAMRTHGPLAPIAERLSELAHAGAKADAELFAHWDSLPDTDDELDPEALKAALNENRRSAGERLLFPEANGKGNAG